MRNSIIGIIIGFFVVISFGIVESKYLEKVSNELTEYIEEIESYPEVDKKITEITAFREMWDKNQKILSVMIDHQDIHKIESTLVEIESIFKNNLNSSQISTNFALLKLYINDMTDERIFTLKNVLSILNCIVKSTIKGDYYERYEKH